MADNKKKVIVYTDWIKIFEKLTDDEAGKLIKHFFAYINDFEPEPENRLIDLLFEPIKQALKRDLKKYLAVCERNKNNGLSGGRPKNEEKEKTQKNPKKPSGLILDIKKPSGEKNNPKKPDNDNDNDNDNDIIDINNTFREKPEKEVKIDFIDLIIKSFSSQFLKYRGVEYFVANQKIERSMAGKILKAYKVNTKNANKTSDQTLTELTEFFEKCMLITDPWINQNMSLSIVISKFNQIINILKNGNKQQGNKQGVTDIQLASIIANKFGSDSPNKR